MEDKRINKKIKGRGEEGKSVQTVRNNIETKKELVLRDEY